jgi:arylsulfatase A-like enzyme
MNRREFLSNSVAAGVVGHLPPGKAKAAKRQPNVLYVFDDQHRAVSLPGEPFAAVAAPNIDKFRRDNMSMDLCISNYPLCCPYRAVLASGKYSAANGVMNNSIGLKTTEFTIHQAFKKSGYHVGYVGKWHLNGDHDGGFAWIPPGPKRFDIDDWHIWEATNQHYKCFTFDEKGNKITTKNWAPMDMTDQAIGLLQKYKEMPLDKPWMLTVSYNPPHPPFDPPQAERNENPVNMQKYRPNVKISADNATPWLKNADAFHHAMQGYIGGITGIDEQFARLMKALDDSGMAGDTIVVFTSDHGEMLGSQGHKGKVLPWEESNHVPFMVRYPGVTPKANSSKELFAAIDIYPSLCGLAGIPVPEHCQGHDLSDLLRGKKMKNVPDVVFIQNGGISESPAHADGGGRKRKKAAAEDADDEESGTSHPYRGVRTVQWTYTVAPNGRWLLYDNLADPYQMNNLIGDPKHKEMMAGFDTRIKAWMKSTGDPFEWPASL